MFNPSHPDQQTIDSEKCQPNDLIRRPDLIRTLSKLLISARRFPPGSSDPDLVLLAIEDVTDRSRAEAAIVHSELRYRRLFHTAKDGILILDADTGKVIDVNPFMTTLLGYSHNEFLGKELLAHPRTFGTRGEKHAAGRVGDRGMPNCQ
jgi:PAS domain-containing protein